MVIGFVGPATYLIIETGKRLAHGGVLSPALARALVNTLTVASIATMITIAAGLMVTWARRALRERASRQPSHALARVGSLGPRCAGHLAGHWPVDTGHDDRKRV